MKPNNKQIQADTLVRQIPLMMLQRGARFRFPGKRKVYTIDSTWGSIPRQCHSPERGYYIEYDGSYIVKNSSGRTQDIRQSTFVIEVL